MNVTHPTSHTHAHTRRACGRRERARVPVLVGGRKQAHVEVVDLDPPVFIQHHLLRLDVVVHDGAPRGLVHGLQPPSGVQRHGHLGAQQPDGKKYGIKQTSALCRSVQHDGEGHLGWLKTRSQAATTTTTMYCSWPPTRRRPTRGVRSPTIYLPRREPGLELAWLVGIIPDPNRLPTPPSSDSSLTISSIYPLDPQPECANRGVLPETQQERAGGVALHQQHLITSEARLVPATSPTAPTTHQ